jgi:cysteine desulfurase/selenocysteine lyase
MFEAGLQNYAGEMGLAAAAKYLESVGMDNIEKHENELTKMIHEGISGTEGVKIIGVSSSKMASGIVSFLVDKVGLHQVAIILDQNHNIMVRSGQHCAHSWFRGHGVEGSVRASLYLYNTKEEAERLIEALKEIIKLR